jgi:thiamine biosynthesis protein ThiC
VAQVTAHMASLMRGVRHIHFKDTLIAVLREEFDDGEWAKVLDEARARHIELEEECD